MKKAFVVVLGCILGLVGFVGLLNVYYNVAGMAGVKDAASGTVVRDGVAALLCAGITIGGFFGSHKMFGLAASPKSPRQQM